VILGKKGCGKTTLCKRLLNQILKKRFYSFVFIWDYLMEYYPTKSNYHAVYSIKDMANYLLHPETRVFVIRDYEGNFDLYCQFIIKLQNLIFVIEEVDSVCNPSFISANFSQILRYGRHRDINIIAISRRPAEINRLVTALATDIICFRFTEPRDLDYLKKLDFDIERIKKLRDYEWEYKAL